MTTAHDTLVQHQFGPTAQDYVSSPTHAQGADLIHIAAMAAQARPVHALDLGCGGGHVAYAMAPHAARITACDLSADMLAAVDAESARRGFAHIATVRAAAEALPFADGAFDFLACRFSAHHWRDVPRGLAEARRVLRPGGMAVFADVIAPPLAAADTHLQAIEVLRDPSHGRNYSAREWAAMLAEAGFAVTDQQQGRLRMEFAAWTARMRTPAPAMEAIRHIQSRASQEVADHFEIEGDGSYTLDTITLTVA
ncbi:class I SAM-dependent methyltransferase [Novosphingobium sp. KACC 22771]|uniref:class I SAM-dependent methyltransferase n=1 Tax=Novosphingobium sp. KACC 22771 TaxID=3025670 RepID=UPI0023672ED2|nr:class I SAM-dependent methyltransferase [Novosphingobium sp. KACC 22771]WDF72607.1 class I SAM-dependent methyltransferase [Novosphingobium sp. KACC 22771]